MSLDFKFDMKSDGWELVETFERYNQHKKQVDIWEKDSVKIAELTLTQCKTSIINYEDLEEVTRYNWCAGKQRSLGYRAATMVKVHGKCCGMSLHQLLTGVGFGSGRGCKVVANHLNRHYHNSYELDNRRMNLEVTSNNVNNQDRRLSKNNTTGEEGITWRENQQCYQVFVAVNDKRLYQPTFSLVHYGSKEAALNEAVIVRDIFKCILHNDVQGNTTQDIKHVVTNLKEKYQTSIFHPKNRREKIVLEMLKRYTSHVH